MDRGAHITKRATAKSVKEQAQQFVEREFDWIAWLTIALLILLSFILFNA